ncbi:MAG: hypothetical protein Q9213_005305 [Squamulea squamosa]
MKIPCYKTTQHGSANYFPSNGSPVVGLLNDCPSLTIDEPSTSLKEEELNRQQEPQSGDKDQRVVLKLYTDREGVLTLAPTPVLRDSEQVIIDAVAPLVDEYNRKYLGKMYSLALRDGADRYEGSQPNSTRAGRKNPYCSVQKRGSSVVLPDRKRRSQSRASVSALKRHKASLKCPPALSADLAEHSTPEAGIKTPDTDGQDDGVNVNSDDDDGEPLLEIESELLDYLTPDDVAALQNYYAKGVCQIGQLMMKKVLRAWVKVKLSKKQSKNPYNGGKNRVEQQRKRQESGVIDRNPGRLTAPDWWPQQDGWPITGCRHKEPDHLRKQERTILALKLLSLTGCDDYFTLDAMREATKDSKDMPLNKYQRRMLEQIYDVREKQQAYLNGEIDGDTRIPVFKPKPQPSRKKKNKASRKRKTAKKVKQEGRDASRAEEQFVQGTTTSTSESVQSFRSSISPLPMAKMEPQVPIVDYESYAQVHYAPTDGSLHFETDMPNPNVPFGPMYASGNPFQQNPHSFMQEPEPFVQSYQAHGLPMPCPAPDRGRMRVRYGANDIRRPTSVCKQDSPSYREGCVPRQVGWDFNDDTGLPGGGFRSKRVSCGRPTDGLQYAIDSPNNHAHGLPLHQQRPLCESFGCSLWRSMPSEEQNGWPLIPFGLPQIPVPSPVNLDAQAQAFNELMRPATPGSEFTNPYG